MALQNEKCGGGGAPWRAGAAVGECCAGKCRGSVSEEKQELVPARDGLEGKRIGARTS